MEYSKAVSHEPTITAELRDRVLARIDVARNAAPDFALLSTMYKAWCDHIPFDNMRKIIALRSGDASLLPGTTGTDFFEAFLEFGCGGTCWPTSNAIYELLIAMGFNARRVAGSMRDQGFVTHGTVIATIDGADWLVDTSILSNVPMPVNATTFISDDTIFTAEIEPTDALHLVWFSIPPNAGYTPCRLLVDPIDHAFHSMSYEKSRTFGAFNQLMYARRNFPGRMVVLRGHTLYARTVTGLETTVLDRDGVCAALTNDFGISQQLVTQWIDVGGLDATFEPFAGPPPVVPLSNPPSSRGR